VIVLLDAGPLGMVTNPKSSPENEACNADMILAAQAAAIAHEGGPTVIATTNVRHFGLFAPACLWREIV
jgi:hypothetical protein